MSLFKITITCLSFILTVPSLAQKLEMTIQRGHYAAIKAVAYTPDGHFLLTGSRDKSIKLWDVYSGREIRSFLGHTSTINDISVSHNGKYFVSSSADKTAKLWNIETGQLLKTFEGHNDYLTSIDLSSDGKLLITAGYDNQAILWNTDSGDTIRTFNVDPDKGLGFGVEAQFSPDDQNIAFGNDNRTILIYNLKSGSMSREFKPETGWCGGCASFVDYSDDGKYLLTASNKGDLQLIDLANKTTHVLATNFKEFRAIDLSSDGKLALMVGEDSLKVYNILTSTLNYARALGYDQPATDAVFSPDSKRIVIVSDDQKINLYHSDNGKLNKTMGGYLATRDKGGLDYDPNSRWDYYIKKYTELKNDMAVSPNGKYLVTGKVGSIARMWEIESGVLTREFHGHEKAVLSMAFTSDGKKLITGSADNTIKIWDVASGNELMTLKGHREVIFSLDLSDDDQYIISGSWDGTAKIWETATGKLLKTLSFENASPYQLEFYNDDIYALIAGLDKSLKMYELDSKTAVKEFVGHTDVVHSFTVSPDHQHLISASWDGKIKSWDIATGMQNWRKADETPIYAVKYSNKGKWVASGGARRVLELRDPKNGKLLKELTGHQAAITNIIFTANDKYLISASEDGMIKIWDPVSGHEIISYLILDQKDWMAISPDGYFNGTQNAFDKVAFVKGMVSYDVDQFFEQYYQPDLMNKAFEKDQHEKINLNEKIEKFPPPSLQILTPHPGDAFKSDGTEVLIRITDEGGGAEGINIIHNGKIIDVPDIKVPPGGSMVISQNLNLVPGLNKIGVSAFSRGRIQSDEKEVSVSREGKVHSTLYVVAVGINKYKNSDLNLNYAAADANSFMQVISDRSKNLFDSIEIIPLINEQASRTNILENLDHLSKKVNPQDVMIFYYAGHGSMVDNKFYFIPTDNIKLYDPEKLKKQAIYAGDVQKKLKNIAALKQLVIIDACQSGGNIQLLATRGAGEEKALAQLSRSTGVHVLAAAGSDQSSVEFEELGHGLFTYILVEALLGKADGAPKDGKVTIYELKSYLDDQVPEFSKKLRGKMQFPHTFSLGQDFPIVID